MKETMDDLKKYTILVVDDEEVFRNTMIFDFKRKGFTVLSAENGNEAIKLVKSNKVDLVLSDIRMPCGDGLTLLKDIRVYDPTIPVVILVTGFADVSEEEVLAKGARNVIPKPFNRKVMMNLVFDALGIKRSHE